jgi:hypothetical protein
MPIFIFQFRDYCLSLTYLQTQTSPNKYDAIHSLGPPGPSSSLWRASVQESQFKSSLLFVISVRALFQVLTFILRSFEFESNDVKRCSRRPRPSSGILFVSSPTSVKWNRCPPWPRQFSLLFSSTLFPGRLSNPCDTNIYGTKCFRAQESLGNSS